jgi:hypothetical protein
MKNRNLIGVGILSLGAVLNGRADERLFTYTYEPETLPQGSWALEQWVTWRAGRTDQVGQDDYNKFEFREELEYGVTDRYTVALYLNTEHLSYRDAAGDKFSDFDFASVSLENVYMVLNPAEKPVGLSLYVEGALGNGEAEIEEKIILGQRHGNWKWALNLVHATEWEDDYNEYEGELEFDFGLAYELSSRWALGFEVRGQSHIPEYEEFEDFALYVGPVLSYRTDRWFAALTVMPQVYGDNFDGDPDGEPHLDLAHHERWNTRLIFGFNF